MKKLVGIFKQVIKTIQLSIFLSRCKLCGSLLVLEGEELICSECKAEIMPVDAPVCKLCGRIVENRHRMCGECIVKPPRFKKHLSYAIYDGVLKDLILLFKYGEIKKLKKLLARYYIEIIEKRINERFDFIIPVPADKSRKRDFSPVYEIAKILSRRLSIPLLRGNLTKIRTTEPQAGLSRYKRLKNLNGAFKVKDPTRVKGKKILLIDDVYTTGTTIKKCSELLAKAKADVTALTLSRSM
ncbi:MAG: ComF family protein [Candidatus Aminicenantes bacterium]|nr:ComF family protein [Candidatus Aminicenantes bacterium]